MDLKYFIFLTLFFFSFPTLFFVLLLPTVLLFTFSFLCSETHISHIFTLVPNTFLAVPERNKEFMSHRSRMSRICIQQGPTLPAASRASLGRSISRSPFFLGLRLPRCEMHAVLYLAIDFLMPAPVHRAPASVVSIDF